jgi:hypothetical protein
VLLRVNEQRNILQEVRKRKGNGIGHILRRNCLLKQVIEGNTKGQVEVTRSCWMTFGTEEVTLICSTSHSVEESFWKMLWTCRLTDY